MKTILNNSNIVPSKRQSPNLKMLLNKSNYSMQIGLKGVTKCNDKRCLCCKQIIEADSVVMENGDRFNIIEKMSCKSRNIIYVIFCMGCSKSYIGETGLILSHRTNLHRSHIRNSNWRQLEVSHHVNECAGHLEIPFKIMPFFKMPLNCTRIERESKELFFSKKDLSHASSRPETKGRRRR